MSLWTRMTNLTRAEKIRLDLDAEIESHIAEAVAEGRDPEEARRAFGSMLRHREQSYDVKVATWLDSLRADVVFGSRQIRKHRIASASAILSLALAIGACTAAFRLIDALLLRPLPVASPEKLHYLAIEGTNDAGKKFMAASFDYPQFQILRDAVKDRAVLLAVSYPGRISLSFGGEAEMEQAYRQHISGSAFAVFGLKPALGRLLSSTDDERPGAHPFAVLSYDYWQRRFGGDPGVIGKRLVMSDSPLEIIGVLEEGFTGTEPGTMTDVFVPMMVNASAVPSMRVNWFRIWAQVEPTQTREVLRQALQAAIQGVRKERVKDWPTSSLPRIREQYLAPSLELLSAYSGVSALQIGYRESLRVLSVLIGLVLLIACANVANLMAAQAASRMREMALRISIGAGRGRLLQLVLMESFLLALFASVLGGLFAWWAAPFVVSAINPANNPARLVLPADWRVLFFACGLAVVVTFLFGLMPALRVTATDPVADLKGGGNPHSKRRLMYVLVSAQVAFCLVVHFVGGLFVASFERLSQQPLGFSAERVVGIEVESPEALGPQTWSQIAQKLQQIPGVEAAGYSNAPFLGGSSWSEAVRMNGEVLSNALSVDAVGASPGWFNVMKIPIRAGRDFQPQDQKRKVAIVNQAFADRHSDGKSPVGQYLERSIDLTRTERIEIVGLIGNIRYRELKEDFRPMMAIPFSSVDADGKEQLRRFGTFLIRTSGDPIPMIPTLRKEIPMRVYNIRTQQEMVDSHYVRERLLALLSVFFASVALLLAGIGLYGVLDYSVWQRRREIAIRMALGAKREDVIWSVGISVVAMIGIGLIAGLSAGLGTQHYVQNLLFAVKTNELHLLWIPCLTIAGAGVIAAIPPLFRALRVAPASLLRAD
ncbi:ABC transporter permease [Bryobacter aggregatus]|uniref:ABC transporter permease n=1 Tax=Bryobacter aggregatus TaxID=360054 RepID=UPI0004E1B279|nr:ABC transporter permease [Bryobacter aggregatus]